MAKHKALLTSGLAIALVFGAAACAGDDDDDDAATENDAGSESGEDSGDYCAAVEEFFDLAQALDFGDEPDPEVMIGNFEALAEAHRAAADAAPDEVKGEHETLASAAEDLVARLVEADPQTVEQFNDAGTEITDQLTEEYGSLDEETAAVEAFAEAECGVGLGGEVEADDE